MSADEGVRQLTEQSDGDITASDKAAAMKSAVEKKCIALRQKMGKLVAVANPDLTDGWFQEVSALQHWPINKYICFTFWLPRI
jgi:hypothetical protein